MALRTRNDCSRLFEVFAKVDLLPDAGCSRHLSVIYPHSVTDQELLDCLPKFTYPIDLNFKSSAIDHFTFVLTDINSQYRFGFCRLAAESVSCLCVVSYHPWFEIFFKLLNYVADRIKNGIDVEVFLKDLLVHSVSKQRRQVEIVIEPDLKFNFHCPDPECFPSIPENRNLMEYYSAVDAENMLIIFASMLFERRIIVTSRKLSRLTACIHAAEALLYPLHWQQIYIPALPPHLLEYCTAPMPYLIGVHSSLLTTERRAELDDAVILDADCNHITCTYDDVTALPSKVVRLLNKRLKTYDCCGKRAPLLGDALPQAFLSALVVLIGDYHAALKTDCNGKRTFDGTLYISLRPSKLRPFLNILQHSQAFQQFIDDRLKMYNSNVIPCDTFEMALNQYVENNKSKVTIKSFKRFKEAWKRDNLKVNVGDNCENRIRSHTFKISDMPRHILTSAGLTFDGNLAPLAVSPKCSLSHSVELGKSPLDGELEAIQHSGSTMTLSPNYADTEALLIGHRCSLLSDPDVQTAVKKSYSADDLFTTQHSPKCEYNSDFKLHEDNDNILDDKAISPSLSEEDLSDSLQHSDDVQADDSDSLDTMMFQPTEAENQRTARSSLVSEQLSRVQTLVKTLESYCSCSATQLPSLEPILRDRPSVADRQRALLKAAECKPVVRTRTFMRSTAYTGLCSVATRKDMLLKYTSTVGVKNCKTSTMSGSSEVYTSLK